MIPKIIHQIWLGDKPKPEMMQTWIDKNPDYEYKLWTEDNLPELVAPVHFHACPSLAGKSDILRYQLLLMYGGIYIDADCECITPLTDDLLDNDSFCCWENEYVRNGLMANTVLGAIPDCKLMVKLIDAIRARNNMNYPEGDTWIHTGPGLLTDTVNQLVYNDIYIYPSHYFIPKHYMGIEYKGNKVIYCKHHFGSTPDSEYDYG